MNIQLVLIVVAVVVALLIAVKRMQARPGGTAAFESRDLLFTPAERSFLGVLEQALDSRYRVFGKVRLGDIIRPAKGCGAGKRTTAQNRINQKHVDFVICTANKLALVGVLELDDRSHARTDRSDRDQFVDQALASAGIPLLRFPARQGYAVQEVRTRLEEMMRATSRSCVVSAAQVDGVPVTPAAAAKVKSNRVQPAPVVPACPKCSAEMVKRQAVKGLNAGKYFWACSNYPTCWQVMEIGEG